MKQLTKPQQNILNRMEKGKEYSAHDLNRGLNHLKDLYKKGLVHMRCKDEELAKFNPEKAYLFEKK